MKEAMRRLRNYGIFVSMLAVALLGSYQYLSGYTTVSNNVSIELKNSVKSRVLTS